MKKNLQPQRSLFIAFIFILSSFNTKAQFTNGQAASKILGQPDYVTTNCVTTQNGMCGARGTYIDAYGNLYVNEVANRRILVFKNAANKSNYANADFVIGQKSFYSKDVNTTQSTLTPYNITFDKYGNLYVADANNRILIYKDIIAKVNSNTLLNGLNADFVLGQPNFSSNTFSTAQNGFWSPTAVTMDSSGNLYVSEDMNSRVLIFKNLVDKVNSNTIPFGIGADYVLGQSDFTSSNQNTTQNGLNGPTCLAVDKTGNLYIGDFNNHRCLIFKNIIMKVDNTTLTNGTNADYIIGQKDFISAGAHLTADGFGGLQGLFFDKNGNLYLSDYSQSRVLIYYNVTSKVNDGTFINGPNADVVLGENDFTSQTFVVDQYHVRLPFQVSMDSSSNLFVPDAFRSAVLMFSPTALPVHLISFGLSNSESQIVLTWQTTNEINNQYFIVEHSTDSKAFVPLNQVSALNNVGINNYSFIDKYPNAGTNYYRLKQVDKDGKFTYSNVLSAIIQNNTSIMLYPNPVKNILNITGLSSSNNYQLTISNPKGVLIASTQLNETSSYNWNIQNLSKGVYYLTIISNNNKQTKKFVKD